VYVEFDGNSMKLELKHPRESEIRSWNEVEKM